MAHSDGESFVRVKVVTDTSKKDYIKVKQVDDTSVKNYLRVKESPLTSKDYKKVVVVEHESPKDYLRVNFIGGIGDIVDDVVDEVVEPAVEEFDMAFNNRAYAKLTNPILFSGSVIGKYKSGGSSSQSYICDGESGPTRGYILVKAGGLAVQFNSSLLEFFVDGVEVSSSALSLPTDGLFHEFEVRAKSLLNLSSIGAASYGSFVFGGSIKDIFITGITGQSYTELSIPLNEPYSDAHELLDGDGNVIGYKVDDIETDYTAR